MTIVAGTKLGRYEIRSKIGEGGMGEVYLALDTELDRLVAIKILPEALASDQQRLQRFVQEAKAASALNHPHILTIYEIGVTGESRFIATEFIEGDTLRRRISAGMTLNEVLEIAIQTGSALAAAHAAGIIHRDLKPDNLMVRSDGYIKLLDFGLAKLTEPKAASTDTEAPTKAMVNTGAGTVMGTANYMSPEQAKGVKVDERTDLWSLGALLYEMIARHVPFAGETPTETISLILQKEPPPLTRYARDVPAELERIVTKCLTKNREERYQTAKDLLIDLRNLKRKIEVDAEIDRTVSPEFRVTASTASGQSIPVTVAGSGPATMPASAAHSASSAEYLVSGIKQHKIAAAIVLIALVMSGIGLSFYLHARNNEVAIESIAVLPFVNTNADANMDYLSDGIAETLINSLSRLQQLRVVARSTAFRYRGKEIDPQVVGRDLNVRAVLMGRVRQVGDSLNIQVDLVDAKTGAQLWGQEYDRKASDALAVKQDIAHEVTEKLRLSLTGEQQKQMTNREATNSEAYQFYLKGRYYWNRRTADGLKKAIEQFQQATDKDPNYALAYVGLADSYLLLEEYAGMPASETFPKAKAYAERALQIDSSLAEAHTSLADVHSCTWNWSEAEREFKRAIELNPNYPTAHHWYSIYLTYQGRNEESLAEIKRALELDPLSLVINTNLAVAYLGLGDSRSAQQQSQKVIELNPSFPGGHQYLGWSYLAQRRYAEAIVEFEKATELTGRSGEDLGMLGFAYGSTGRRDEALAIIKEMNAKYLRKEAAETDMASVYAGIGNKDEAFKWLEKAFQAHSSLLPGIGSDLQWESLRTDPRYANLMQRMGLKH